MSAVVQEGEVLADKYRVERILRQGGMGIVVAALHLELRSRVALKFLLPSACTVPEAVSRFLREARAASKIQSPHVVRVTDVGKLESGAPFMVMELLRGADLGEIIETRGPLLVPDAVEWVLQACEAIAEAHALGIVHRDLKPSNLFLTRQADGSPFIKVLDFGISKAIGPPDAESTMSTTTTTAFLGSPAYMSPEQVRSAKSVDARTDIWALGVVLHELLTGAPVYQGENVSSLMAMILTDPPTPVRQLRADVPSGLEQVILRCLQKDRARRYATVGELAAALAPFASSSTAQSKPVYELGRQGKALVAAAVLFTIALVGTVLVADVVRSHPAAVAAALLFSVAMVAVAVWHAAGRSRVAATGLGPVADSPASRLDARRLAAAAGPHVISSLRAVANPRAEGGDASESPFEGHVFRFLPRAPIMVKKEVERLSKLGRTLSGQTDSKVRIVGYGDEQEADLSSRALAKYRARLAQVLLVKAGVAGERVTLVLGDFASDARLARSIHVTTVETPTGSPLR
jgi:hypothetical protein